MDQYEGKAREIIDAAHGLFWKYGVKKVTVEEICKEAGVSKMTFYREFKNKIEVAKAVLKDFTEDGIKKYRAIMSSDISFHEKMKRATLLKAEASENISREFIADIMLDQHSELKEYMDQISAGFWKEVRSDYEKAIENNEMRKDINLDFFLIFNNKIMMLFEDEELKKLYPDPKDLIMEIMNLVLFGVENRDRA